MENENSSNAQLLIEDYQEVYQKTDLGPDVASLADAIKTAPQKELANILQTIVVVSKSAHDKVFDRLLTPIHTDRKYKGRRETYHKTFEHCRQCNSDYTVASNDIGHCCYHPGLLRNRNFFESVHAQVFQYGIDFDDEDDEEFIDDEDELETRHEAGHWHRYTCCRQPAYANGCVVTRHDPRVYLRSEDDSKRARESRRVLELADGNRP